VLGDELLGNVGNAVLERFDGVSDGSYLPQKMNEIDPDKEWRLQRETEMFDSSFVDQLGERLLRFLEKRTNKEVFNKINGRLKVNIPTGGDPNARVIVSKDKPLEPTIEITFSMLLEIYKDAFAFPLISKRIQMETDAIQALNSDMFKGAAFTFDSAVPEFFEKQLVGPLLLHATTMAKLVHEHGDARMEKNDVYCRFLMFEITMAWTFFHELSHALQQHHAVRDRLGESNAGTEHINELVGDVPADTNLFGQAREILADAEGIHLTLEYLAERDRLNYATTYLVLCGVSCMFQRFYNSHDDHLGIVAGQHPHPVIRDEFVKVTVLKWLIAHILKTRPQANRKQTAIALVYLNTRASLMTGFYRAFRIEKTGNGKLPSYMALQSKEEHTPQRRVYMHELGKHIMRQFPIVKELHLTSADVLAPLIEFAERLQDESERGAGCNWLTNPFPLSFLLPRGSGARTEPRKPPPAVSWASRRLLGREARCF
jgi:hypothetical protein